MKTGLLIAGLVGSAIQLASAEESRMIRATPGLVQSINATVQLHMEGCKHHSIAKELCEQSLSDELTRVRAYVDKVCGEKAPKDKQEECITEGLEWILDNRVIPAKVELLKTKHI